MNEDFSAKPTRGRGRPATGGRDPHYIFRAPPALIAELRAAAARRGIATSAAARDALAAYIARLGNDTRTDADGAHAA
jgi:hypothetical protein